MTRHQAAAYSYDPRPVDSVRLTLNYDWSNDRYRLSVTVKRHGEATPATGTHEGLTIDDAGDMCAVIFSSLGRDGSTLSDPF